MGVMVMEMDATAVNGGVEIPETVTFDSPTSVTAWAAISAFFQNADIGGPNSGNVECAIASVTTQNPSGAQNTQSLAGGLGVDPTFGSGVFFGDDVVAIQFILSVVSFSDREVGARGVGVVLF